MGKIIVQYPDELIASTGKSREEIERHLRFQFAAQMYAAGEFSLGQAAETLGITRLAFMDELGESKIPLINFDDVEVRAELHAVREYKLP
jgi:predicted HTH domain antitoxin